MPQKENLSPSPKAVLSEIVNSLCPDVKTVELFRKLVMADSKLSACSWNTLTGIFDASINNFQGIDKLRDRVVLPKNTAELSPQMHLAHAQFILYCIEHTDIRLNLAPDKETTILDRAIEIRKGTPAKTIEEKEDQAQFILRAKKRIQLMTKKIKTPKKHIPKINLNLHCRK